MKYSVIDIGSNSIRLTAYTVEKDSFHILFHEKVMAGLAGYVKNGTLQPDGIRRACSGLTGFRHTLDQLELTGRSVFATASLRGIDNTRQAADALSLAIGQPVEVLSGEEEARLGYLGAMVELNMDRGLFLDIGGASTELVSFSGCRLQSARSFPIGSLKLYRDCVKRILPGNGSLHRLRQQASQALDLSHLDGWLSGGRIVCVGGTARAALKLAQAVFQLPSSCRVLSAVQLDKLYRLLEPGGKRAIDLILKTAPERIHTLIPGLVILRHTVMSCSAAEIIVSQYGVREGFLCQRIQSKL